MKRQTGAVALAMAVLLSSGAALADQCHSGPFNGLYIGATAGYAGLDSEQRPLGDPKLSSDDDSFIVGGHVGYNMQCGRVVVGVEGDLSYLDLETRATQPDQTSYTTSVEGFATLRGRLGITVHPNMLVYATAGVAWADRTHHLVAPNAPGGFFEQSDSDWTTGWVIGGGVELLRDDRWSIRAEVLWADLGSEDRTYVVTGCGGVPCTANVRWDDEILTARVGVSLKLGSPERQYEPLK